MITIMMLAKRNGEQLGLVDITREGEILSEDFEQQEGGR